MQLKGPFSEDATVHFACLLVRVLQLGHIFTTQLQKVANLGRGQQQVCQRLYLL